MTEALRLLLVAPDAAVATRVVAAVQEAARLEAEVTVVGDAVAVVGFDGDVVLVDVDSCEGDLETFRQVCRLLPQVPIIALIDERDTPASQQALLEGAVDDLLKPLLSGDLLECAVRRAVDRARSQHYLGAEQERLFAVLETLPLFVYVLAPDGSIPFANRRFRELFGEVAGRRCYELFRGRDHPCALCPPRRVQRTGKPVAFEWTDAAGRTYAVYDKPFPGTRDMPLTLEVGVDITEQLRAQRRLAESEERFWRLAENVPDIVYRYRFAPEPGFDYISPSVEKLLGYPPAAFYADPGLLLRWVHPDDRELLQWNLRGEMPDSRSYDMRWIDDQGALHWMEDRHHTIRDAEGRMLGIEGIARDITEWKRAQLALAESEARVRAVLDAVPDLFFQLDHEGRFTLYHAPPELLYVPEEKFLGRRMEEVLPRDVAERSGAALRRVLATGGMEAIEYSLPRGDERRDYEARLVPSGTDNVLVIVRDITARRQATDALETADQIVRSSPSGMLIYRFDPPDRLVLVDGNVEAERLTGIRLDEWRDKAMESIWPAAKTAGLIDSFLEVLRTGIPFFREELAVDDARTSGTFRVRAFRIPNDRLVVSFEDVSDLKRAERELRESEARYRTLFEDAVLGIYQTTPDGRILAANPALVRILGYDSFDELARRNLEQEGYEPETPRWQFKERIEREGSITGLDSAWQRRDGRTIYVRENARVVCDRNGMPLYYEGTIEDDTERKRAERDADALRAQLELTQYSIDSTEAVVLWVRPDGRLTYVNEAACRMLGYERDELLDMAVWEIDVEYPETRRGWAWEELRSAGSESSESTFRRKNGALFPVEINARYLVFRGRELEFAVAFDITERKRLEAQLRQSQRLESIGTLASGVAHEINNPLTGIINYAQLIVDRIDNERLKEYAEGIREEGERVASIVRSLLSFSRQEKEPSSPARLIDIVNGALSLYEALLRRDRIALLVEVPEDLPTVRCRSQEIRQVVLNLLTNARDASASEPSGEERERWIAVRGCVVDDGRATWVRLTVEDNGPGIAPEMLERVFDPFFTTKPRDQGTGLGLSVSYGLVREHGGTMSVESVPGQLTRFVVDLPVGDGPSPPERGASALRGTKKGRG